MGVAYCQWIEVPAAGRFIEVDVDALQLQVGVAVVGASGVNACRSKGYKEMGNRA